MEIVLIRHGKPNIETAGKVNALGFGAWVSEYEMAGIDDESRPHINVIKRANKCNFTVCSDLARSVESAALLDINAPELICSSFRECEMPYKNWQYPKLSKLTWSIIFRLLQIAGYSPNAESYKLIKIRTKKCANHLVELANAHESVLFVGHGTLIWFIHKHLVNMGWVAPNKPARNHWEYGEYVCN